VRTRGPEPSESADPGLALRPEHQPFRRLHPHANNPFNFQAIAPGSSNRHENRSYHLVAPTPFNWLAPPLPTPSSITFTGSTLDAVRSIGSHYPGLPYACLSESRLNVTLQRVVEDCYCSPNGGSPIYYHQTMPKDTAQPPTFNFASCNATGFPTAATMSTVPLPGDLPTGFVQQYLGRWPASNDADPPITLFAVVAALEYQDLCSTTTTNLHGAWGVTTLAGTAIWAIAQPALIGVSVLTDLGNAVNANDPFQAPAGGQEAVSNIVWQFSR